MHNIKMTIKYKFLPFLFACIALVSCIDDDLLDCIDDNEIPEMFADGYSLNMIATLDKMGGTRAVELVSKRGRELEALESYIDPEKFRVLFFDRQERFLFESKSRWVKKILPTTGDNDHSEWFVAVPLYAYGNDESEEWNWEEIRRVLTGEDMDEDIEHYTNPNLDPDYKFSYDTNVIQKVINGELKHAFKIAILANRPELEWNMGINGRDSNGDLKDANGKLTAIITDKGWYIKNGPIWKKEHTRWGDNPKTVFDLHHCQYDPVYDGKNYNDRENTTTPPSSGDYVTAKDANGKAQARYYTNYHVYDFIAGKVKEGEGFDEKKGKPTMGATSTWIDWSGNDGETNGNANKGKTSANRFFMPPTEEHPIPMYGIQNFNKLENWVKGTPFNLSKVTSDQDADYEYQTISLLRSVVKLELVLPSTMNPYWVALIYSNVYARCEPMNVWDPTDKIWSESDDNPHSSGYEWKEGDCEWYNIRKYGATTRDSDFDFIDFNQPNVLTGSVQRYQERMSWFYGAWSEEGPDGKQRWGNLKLNGEGYVSQDGTTPPPFPQIFNSCVQRVGNAICHEDTPERKNRPYGLLTYEELDGRHYVVYTGERNINDPSILLQMGNYKSGAPVVCYWQIKETSDKNSNRYSIAFAYNEEQTGKFKSYITDTEPSPKSAFGSDTDPRTGDPNSYEQAVQFNKAAMPWPLVRNHVYRIWVRPAKPVPPIDIPVTWDLTTYSPETLYDLANDKNDVWGKVLNKDNVTTKGWSNKEGKSVANQELTANGNYIKETRGLKFDVGSAKERVNFEYDVFYPNENKYFLRLEKSSSVIFPKLPNDCYLTIVTKIPVVNNETHERYIEFTEGDLEYVNGDIAGKKPYIDNGKYYVYGAKYLGMEGSQNYRYIYTWKVNSYSVKFRICDAGGLAFEKFRITKENPWVNGSYVDDGSDPIVGQDYNFDSNGARAFTKEDEPQLVTRSEHLYSKSINFNKAKIEKKISGEKKTEKGIVTSRQ